MVNENGVIGGKLLKKFFNFIKLQEINCKNLLLSFHDCSSNIRCLFLRIIALANEQFEFLRWRHGGRQSISFSFLFFLFCFVFSKDFFFWIFFFPPQAFFFFFIAKMSSTPPASATPSTPAPAQAASDAEAQLAREKAELEIAALNEACVGWWMSWWCVVLLCLYCVVLCCACLLCHQEFSF